MHLSLLICLNGFDQEEGMLVPLNEFNKKIFLGVPTMFTKLLLNDEAKKELQGHSEKKNSMR